MPLIRGHHTFEDHYTQLPNAWLRDPNLSLRSIGLLAQLMSHRPGWSVSLRSLADANKCGIDAIRSSVSELIEAGYLERSEARVRNELGHLSDYTYTTRDPDTSPTLDLPTLDKPTLGNPITKNNIIQEQQEPKKYPQAELEVAFNEFWNHYPRKVEKLAAQRAFAKACKEVESATIVAGARRLSADPNLPPKQFIPYPASWLNAGGWESEPYPERERTPEEKAALAAESNARKREVELAASARLRDEQRAAEAQAKLNPPKRCEHDRVAVMCRVCSKDVAS